MSGPSRIVRWGAGGWAGIDPRAYQDEPGAYRGVARHTLLGPSHFADGVCFEVRYFEVEPGGFSSLERHAHAHAVMVLRGQGRVRLGDRIESVRAFDVVYVAPDEVHRFEAAEEEPLGFLCVVDAERDRPVRVGE